MNASHAVNGMIHSVVNQPKAGASAEYALAALSLGAGCADVVSFLKLGYLFTSAMTGNTALLAIALGRGDLVAAAGSLTALVGFGLGVALASVVRQHLGSSAPEPGNLRRLLIVELVFLTGCAVLWNISREPLASERLYAIITLASLSMGIQAVAAYGIRPGISTIVFTSVLIHIVISAIEAITFQKVQKQPNSIKPHLGTFAAYICGGILAAVCVSRYLTLLVWVPVVAVLASRYFLRPEHV